jgi:hypothetical protein
MHEDINEKAAKVLLWVLTVGIVAWLVFNVIILVRPAR